MMLVFFCPADLWGPRMPGELKESQPMSSPMKVRILQPTSLTKFSANS